MMWASCVCLLRKCREPVREGAFRAGSPEASPRPPGPGNGACLSLLPLSNPALVRPTENMHPQNSFTSFTFLSGCPSFIRKKADNAALLWPVSCSPLRCTALGEKEAGFFGDLDVVWLHFLLNDPCALRMLVAAPQAACPPRAPRPCCCWVYGAFCSVWPRVTALGGGGRSCPHGAQVQTMGRPRGSMFYCETV